MTRLIIILTSLLLLNSCADYVNVKVEDKERISTINDSYYLIFTDKGVFKNDDNVFFLKFNSSDLYGKLKIGDCFSLKKRFWRLKIFSMYENIMEAEKIQCSSNKAFN